MTDIAKRVRALRLLRDVFMLSFIVGACSLVLLAITLPLGINEVNVPAGIGMTIVVFETIFDVLRLVAIVLFALALILTIQINKECRIAFWLGIVAGVLAIIAGVFQYSMESRVSGYVLGMISTILLALAVYALVDGIFEKQARGTSLFALNCVGIGLMILAAIAEFVAVIAGLPHDVASSLYLISIIFYFLGNLIVFLCLNKTYKTIKGDKEIALAEQKEREAQ